MRIVVLTILISSSLANAGIDDICEGFKSLSRWAVSDSQNLMTVGLTGATIAAAANIGVNYYYDLNAMANLKEISGEIDQAIRVEFDQALKTALTSQGIQIVESGKDRFIQKSVFDNLTPAQIKKVGESFRIDFGRLVDRLEYAVDSDTAHTIAKTFADDSKINGAKIIEKALTAKVPLALGLSGQVIDTADIANRMAKPTTTRLMATLFSSKEFRKQIGEHLAAVLEGSGATTIGAKAGSKFAVGAKTVKSWVKAVPHLGKVGGAASGMVLVDRLESGFSQAFAADPVNFLRDPANEELVCGVLARSPEGNEELAWMISDMRENMKLAKNPEFYKVKIERRQKSAVK
jgi:hypothetical protein